MPPLLNYPPLATLPLGPFTVYVWGIFVGLGILAATWVATRRGRRNGIAPQQLWDLAFWVVLAGLVGARLLYVAEYWQDFAHEPWRVFAVWEGGMSAFGALALGALAGLWYARRHRLLAGTLAAAAAPAALLGDAIGRLGGAWSHMYPGIPTSFPISYVLDGVQRHEAGIELALASLVGFFVVLGIERRFSSFITRRSSFTPALALAWYSASRFLLDFLRAADLPTSDLRYAGLTLAQYLSAIGAVVALFALVRGRRDVTRVLC